MRKERPAKKRQRQVCIPCDGKQYRNLHYCEKCLVNGDGRLKIDDSGDAKLGNILRAAQNIPENSVFSFWGVFKPGRVGDDCADTNDYEMQAKNGVVDPVPFGKSMPMQYANAPREGDGFFFRNSKNPTARVIRLEKAEFTRLFKDHETAMKLLEGSDFVYIGEIVHVTNQAREDDQIFLEYGSRWFHERCIVRIS